MYKKKSIEPNVLDENEIKFRQRHIDFLPIKI